MSVKYATKTANGRFQLFANYDMVRKTLINHYNARQAQLFDVAMAYYDSLKAEKAMRPASSLQNIKRDAMHNIATRINGGRFVRYSNMMKNGDVVLSIEAKKIRVDFSEIDYIESRIIVGNDTLRKPAMKDFPTQTLNNPFFLYHMNGATLRFNKDTKTVVLDATSGKFGYSRFKNSYNGRFFLRLIKRLDKYSKSFGFSGLAGGYIEINTLMKNGNHISEINLYGEHKDLQAIGTKHYKAA